MRALVPLAMAAFPAQADILPPCFTGQSDGHEQCEDIGVAKQTLLSSPLPAGLRGTAMQVYFNLLYFQVNLDGVATGNEGSQIKSAICSLSVWRELLDREYRMSVRMTHRQGDLIRLDEIAFIEDCEAD
jgi:hypothetical protein